MLNAQGKPRYWLGTYDAWHLLIPVALAAVLAVWALSPQPRPARPAAAVVLVPMAPSAITIPAAGTNLTVRNFTAIQGMCQPQARVFLFLRQIPNPEQLLAETRSDTHGVFRFTMAPFPPGDYGFRVEAVAAPATRDPDGGLVDEEAHAFWMRPRRIEPRTSMAMPTSMPMSAML